MTAGPALADGLAGARTVLERADELASRTASSTGIDRFYLTPEHAQVNAIVGSWMREARMRSWQDPAGNQCGRLEGEVPGLPALLLGSHLDTVPGAGRYDGVLGVLVAIAVVARLDPGALPFAVEVAAFGDEEGARFGTTLLGSRALAGTWQPEWVDLVDSRGETLQEAALTFGLEPERIGEAAREPDSLIGYLEAHIEQGTRLEAAGRSLGVVTGIAAARRFLLTLTGHAGHCATPPKLRRDALLGASEAILAIERIAGEQGSPATVGHLGVRPDAVNVIPGVAEFSLDLRDETDEARDETWALLRAEVERIAAARGLTLGVVATHEAPAVRASAGLAGAVRAGIRSTGDAAPIELFSIAGHDAMALATLTDVGMLFVRCGGGVSHHADEAVTAADVADAIDALHAAVLALAAE